MNETVMKNMDMKDLQHLLEAHPGGIFITDIQQVNDTFTVTFSSSSDVKALEDMAFTDYLSGVYNRRYFVEQLDSHIAKFHRSGRLFGIVYLDLDDFSGINNTYGHDIGDIVIQHTARSLERSFKRKTDIVARLGGDEFVVLLSDMDNNSNIEKACKVICAKLIETLSHPINIGDSNITITASVGVAFSEKNDLTIKPSQLAKTMMQRADKAMYKAKEQGKNTYSIYSKNKNNKGDNNVYKTDGGD